MCRSRGCAPPSRWHTHVRVAGPRSRGLQDGWAPLQQAERVEVGGSGPGPARSPTCTHADAAAMTPGRGDRPDDLAVDHDVPGVTVASTGS